MNVNNFGIFIGRLVKDPIYYQNSDGSFSVIVDAACQQNFASGQDHTYQSDFIEFRGYVPKGVKHHGVYSYLGTGDKVSLQYTMRSGMTEKNGTKNYYQHLFIESVQILEGKTVREQRRAAKNA